MNFVTKNGIIKTTMPIKVIFNFKTYHIHLKNPSASSESHKSRALVLNNTLEVWKTISATLTISLIKHTNQILNDFTIFCHTQRVRSTV
jgi:hypothetical protein